MHKWKHMCNLFPGTLRYAFWPRWLMDFVNDIRTERCQPLFANSFHDYMPNNSLLITFIRSFVKLYCKQRLIQYIQSNIICPFVRNYYSMKQYTWNVTTFEMHSLDNNCLFTMKAYFILALFSFINIDNNNNNSL